MKLAFALASYGKAKVAVTKAMATEGGAYESGTLISLSLLYTPT